jgi:hypothetical protein
MHAGMSRRLGAGIGGRFAFMARDLGEELGSRSSAFGVG